MDLTRRRTLLAVLGTVGGAGCLNAQPGDDGGGEPPTANHDDGHGHHDVTVPDGPAAAVQVTAHGDDGQHFSPHLAWVETGGRVTWTMESGSHTVTAYASANDRSDRIPADAAAWDSGTLAAGESFERSFDSPGVYDYFCRPHESAGMVGTVLVGRPHHHDAPGLTTPGEELPASARDVLHSLNEAVETALDGGHSH